MGRDGETEKKGCLGTEKADPLGIDELFGDTGFCAICKENQDGIPSRKGCNRALTLRDFSACV